MAASLERAGYWVAAIRPPTVPEGRARLRVTLSALHAASDVDGLVDALAQARDASAGVGTDAHSSGRDAVPA
jgi:8-amino-7-oxononanoate synthase